MPLKPLFESDVGSLRVWFEMTLTASLSISIYVTI
jgi:hypothetical protein